MTLSFWSTIIVSTTTTLTFAMTGMAAAATTKSTVTITKAEADDEGVDIKGNVASSRVGCKNKRKVEVWHDVDPKGPSEDDFKLGTVTTNKKGKWSLSTTFFPDKVYAIVKTKLNPPPGCKTDRSPREEVDFDD